MRFLTARLKLGLAEGLREELDVVVSSETIVAYTSIMQPTALGIGVSSPIHGLEPAASIHSSLQPAALGHVGSRSQLSPRVLPFTSVTHFYMGYYSFYRPQKDERLNQPS